MRMSETLNFTIFEAIKTNLCLRATINHIQNKLLYFKLVFTFKSDLVATVLSF